MLALEALGCTMRGVVVILNLWLRVKWLGAAAMITSTSISMDILMIDGHYKILATRSVSPCCEHWRYMIIIDCSLGCMLHHYHQQAINCRMT